MDNNNMLKLCRLCLVKDDVNIPIFEEQGDIRQIFLKISSCLPVKVSRDDQLPKKICDGCSYKLDMLYEFWNTSANAEKQLLTWLGEAGMSSQMADGTISAVAQQIKPADAFVKQETIDPPDIHMDDDDDDDEEDKDYMKQEDNSNNVEEPPPKRARRTAAVKAAIALDQNSDDDDDSGEPMTKVEDDSEDSDNEDHEPAFVDVPSTSADDQPGPSGVGKDGVEAPKIKSPVKKTDDPSVKKLEKPPNEITKKGIGHVRGDNVAEEEKPEVVEGKVRKKREHKPKKPSLREVQRLLQKDSNPNIINLDELPNPLKCSACNESFQTNREYAYHSVKHNNDNQYTCHFCDYKTDQKKQIKAHMLQHSVFKCKICEKIFKKRHSAYKHGERHMENNKVQCEICGKSLQSQSLKTHMKIVHTDEMNNQAHFCPICNKAYRYSSSVRKHISANHRELGIDVSVVCDICGKRISSKSKLMKHLSIHTGDKPHSCTVCYKKFRAIDTLRSHMVVHTGEKPYKCSYCGKGFGQNAPYRYHIKTHTGEKNYSCTICGKGFISKANWRLHIKTCDILATGKVKF
ncbi:zinc finger protein 260-like isoform X19 [Diorhabda carinulata]|uniref:zinc finger protein 260-like isoform X19 n=1 Tax=Diorhabda carinulata TaxID=1163345 RepID=UPI0025A08075|nr:zinc finger protein 260-like isoform X19 [Diorhabda carinulata]